MENLEMIKIAENGQMYIDFESLESITNIEFVEEVKRAYRHLNGMKIKKDVSMLVDNDLNWVKIYMSSVYGIRILTYLKESKFISNSFIQQFDIDQIDLLINGGGQVIQHG